MTMTDDQLPVPPPPPAPPAPVAATARPVAPAAKPDDSSSESDIDFGYVDKGAALSRLPKIPFEVFLVMIVGLIMVGIVALLLWGSAGDQETRADDAVAELAAAQAEVVELEAQAAVAATMNADLQADIVTLEAQEPVVTVEEVPAASAPASAPESDDVVAQIEAELSTATARVAELEGDLTAAQAQITTMDAALAIASSAGNEQSADAFVQFVGETLASADGLRISADESRCLGRTVVDDIGLGSLGAGLNSGRSAAVNNVVIDSIVRAVDSCGIDPRRVFGQ